MAQIALVMAATQAGWGTTAVMLTAAAGAYIDSAFVFPKLFPGDPVDAGKIGDIQLMSTEEGSPIALVGGALCKVPGVLLWTGGVDTVEQSQSIGKSSSVVNRQYYVSAAVLLVGSSIGGVIKVWADGELVYDLNRSALSETSTQISITTPLLLKSIADFNVPSSAGINFVEDGWRISPNAKVTVAGATLASNNGTFTPIYAYTNATSGDSRIRLQRTSGVFTAAAAGANITLSQTVPRWTPGTTKAGSTPAFYRGQTTNTPDPHIESYLGAGNVPAWRGWTYMMLPLWNVTRSQGRMQSFEALVERTTNATLDVVIKDLAQDLGWSLSLFDVTGIATTVGGYVVYTPNNLRQALQPLLLAFDVMAQDRAGKLHFFFRDDSPEVEVDSSDYSYGSEGDTRDRVAVERMDPSSLPGEMQVKFIDSDNDHRQGSYLYKVQQVTGVPTLIMDLGIVMTRAEAAAIARRTLWRIRDDFRKVRFTLPPKYLRVLESDELVMTIDGAEHVVTVTRVTVGANYLMEIEGLIFATHDIVF